MSSFEKDSSSVGHWFACVQKDNAQRKKRSCLMQSTAVVRRSSFFIHILEV